MGVAAHIKRAIDALARTIIADRLGDGGDMIFVEGGIQRRTPMAGGAEGHTLGGIGNIRLAIEKVVFQFRQIDDLRRRRQCSGAWINGHCRYPFLIVPSVTLTWWVPASRVRGMGAWGLRDAPSMTMAATPLFRCSGF